MNQKPSIGRIVHYHVEDCEPLAAIITAVVADKVVDLCVFAPDGISFQKNVLYGEDDARWSWPPRV
ncbi:hypothetical protein FLT15_31675 [Paenibacillus thiaminolyticus]|nr:hypothetical protein [Paenibacillus thiaminolyticus]NGP62728.1 hypothetical protein [Paenibacillus thiaminolyticus]